MCSWRAGRVQFNIPGIPGSPHGRRRKLYPYEEVVLKTEILRRVYPGVGDRFSDPLLKTLELWSID